MRVFVVALPFYRDDWRPAIWMLAVLSLVVGSFIAVVQTDVKRMLAYSSISHAGFILVGVEAAGHRAGEVDSGLGVPSVVVYLLAYAVLVAGTFAIVALVARLGDGDTSLDSFRGLGKQRPLLAIALTVFLVAQAGVPFTSGFIAKFGVIRAARRRAQLRAGADRHADVGRRCVPLPADHGQHVDVRPAAEGEDAGAGARAALVGPGHRRRRAVHARSSGSSPSGSLDAAKTTTQFAR